MRSSLDKSLDEPTAPAEVPDQHMLVEPARVQRAVVRGEGQRQHRAIVPGQIEDLPAGRHVPDDRGLISRSGSQQAAVMGELERPDNVRVPAKPLAFGQGRRVEDQDVIAFDDGNGRAVGTDLEAVRQAVPDRLERFVDVRSWRPEVGRSGQRDGIHHCTGGHIEDLESRFPGPDVQQPSIWTERNTERIHGLENQLGRSRCFGAPDSYRGVGDDAGTRVTDPADDERIAVGAVGGVDRPHHGAAETIDVQRIQVRHRRIGESRRERIEILAQSSVSPSGKQQLPPVRPEAHRPSGYARVIGGLDQRVGVVGRGPVIAPAHQQGLCHPG